jgi:hypothetical protein
VVLPVWLPHFHVRGGFGEEVARPVARATVADFDEAAPVAVKSGGWSFAVDGCGDVGGHHLGFGVGEYPGAWQWFADAQRDRHVVTDRIDTLEICGQGVSVGLDPTTDADQLGLCDNGRGCDRRHVGEQVERLVVTVGA